MSTINIQGIDRQKLLHALWKRAPVAAYYGSGKGPDFYITEALKQVSVDGYCDYICGRPIKTNIFNQDEIDPRMYDRDAGEGAFQEVMDSLQ